MFVPISEYSTHVRTMHKGAEPKKSCPVCDGRVQDLREHLCDDHGMLRDHASLVSDDSYGWKRDFELVPLVKKRKVQSEEDDETFTFNDILDMPGLSKKLFEFSSQRT